MALAAVATSNQQSVEKFYFSAGCVWYMDVLSFSMAASH
jgi:hypothetical protein